MDSQSKKVKTDDPHYQTPPRRIPEYFSTITPDKVCVEGQQEEEPPAPDAKPMSSKYTHADYRRWGLLGGRNRGPVEGRPGGVKHTHGKRFRQSIDHLCSRIQMNPNNEQHVHTDPGWTHKQRQVAKCAPKRWEPTCAERVKIADAILEQQRVRNYDYLTHCQQRQFWHDMVQNYANGRNLERRDTRKRIKSQLLSCVIRRAEDEAYLVKHNLGKHATSRRGILKHGDTRGSSKVLLGGRGYSQGDCFLHSRSIY